MKTLKTAVENYLDLRRAFGFKLDRDQRELKKFVSFMHRENAPYITTELILRFAKRSPNASSTHCATLFGVVRRFALYWSSTDTRTEVPPEGLLIYKYHRKNPYLYTSKEIEQLINGSSKLPSKLGLRKKTYSTLFGLLAVTGMRHNEVVTLDRDDVDLIQGVLKIRGTKFGKYRLVPLHITTVRALKKYVQYRDRIYPKPKTRSFFISENGIRLTKWSVRHNFIVVSYKIGLRKVTDSHGPRIHDLRHHFAIQTLIGWYQTGINVDAHMALLSTYLGHTHPSDTYWYLSAAPELLGLAASRLEKQMGGLR